MFRHFQSHVGMKYLLILLICKYIINIKDSIPYSENMIVNSPFRILVIKSYFLCIFGKRKNKTATTFIINYKCNVAFHIELFINIITIKIGVVN